MNKIFTLLTRLILLISLVACGGETPTATEQPTLTSSEIAIPRPEFDIGSSMTSETDGMELVYVPAGEFEMGNEGDVSNESPVHTVSLEAFWIDKTEVTNAMFSLFITDTGHQTVAEANGRSQVYQGETWSKVTGAGWAHPLGPDSNLDGLEQYPVVHVGWADAEAYCAWAGRRLPTEAEWEKAARGTDGRTYPSGNEVNSNTANYDSLLGEVTQVRSYPDSVSPYGALDMAGNAWEFVADWFSGVYYQDSPLENPTGPEFGSTRVVRGGSWSSGAEFVRSAFRGQHPPNDPFSHVGFRCAVSE